MNNLEQKPQSCQTDVMRGLIKIYKHPTMANSVTAYFNQCALDIIGEKEIVLIENMGQLTIRRPSLDSKRTLSLRKGKVISFGSPDAEALVGEYYIEQDDNADEFLLNLA
jgi:hypothetical protein